MIGSGSGVARGVTSEESKVWTFKEEATVEPMGPGSVAFWDSEDAWVALPPGGTADGLAVFAAGLGLGGCCLFQTSGSEGAAKWVLLTKAAMLASARAVCAHLEVTSVDRWLLALPQWHVGGSSLWARSVVSGSSVVVMEGKWQPERFVGQCGEDGATLTSLVPTQVFDLVQAGLVAPSSLRAVVVGGGRLEPELGRRARALGWPVLQSYGMTEAGSQVATEPLEHLKEGFDPDELEVLPHWSVSVDEAGRLVLGGEALAAGYIKREAAGWVWEPLGDAFTTRDLVGLREVDGRRFLRFLGREAQALKILGELVHLGPLQSRLAMLALERGIKDVQLGAMSDERSGQVVVLRCRRGMEVPAEVLREAYNDGVRPFERAVRVVSAEVNEMGKMQR